MKTSEQQEAVAVHTVELFDRACELARQLGYEVRREWLGGATGGCCEFGGRKWIFLDLSLSQIEQLDQIRNALLEMPELQDARLGPTMQTLLGRPKQAA